MNSAFAFSFAKGNFGAISFLKKRRHEYILLTSVMDSIGLIQVGKQLLTISWPLAPQIKPYQRIVASWIVDCFKLEFFDFCNCLTVTSFPIEWENLHTKGHHSPRFLNTSIKQIHEHKAHSAQAGAGSPILQERLFYLDIHSLSWCFPVLNLWISGLIPFQFLSPTKNFFTYRWTQWSSDQLILGVGRARIPDFILRAGQYSINLLRNTALDFFLLIYFFETLLAQTTLYQRTHAQACAPAESCFARGMVLPDDPAKQLERIQARQVFGLNIFHVTSLHSLRHFPRPSIVQSAAAICHCKCWNSNGVTLVVTRGTLSAHSVSGSGLQSWGKRAGRGRSRLDYINTCSAETVRLRRRQNSAHPVVRKTKFGIVFLILTELDEVLSYCIRPQNLSSAPDLFHMRTWASRIPKLSILELAGVLPALMHSCGPCRLRNVLCSPLLGLTIIHGGSSFCLSAGIVPEFTDKGDNTRMPDNSRGFVMISRHVEAHETACNANTFVSMSGLIFELVCASSSGETESKAHCVQKAIRSPHQYPFDPHPPITH
ncbi:hypothetical protein VP01_3239g1 [Puccinia sorghi]|uniref:Uncharacterized protein n=1 Tax=Puccinia sorghi TaxID=27349 RepID=A0A0L6V006_9BASI|nr:hypothetical protein VP01_3239g1 [Puccinia sorghi]